MTIEDILNIDNYATDERVSRRKGAGSTQEFFTPYSIVKRMADKIPDSDWANPDKTFLEPCLGNGQFCLYIIYNKVMHGVDPIMAVKNTFGNELMQDNVDECKERVINMFHEFKWEVDEEELRRILDENIHCGDFFEYCMAG